MRLAIESQFTKQYASNPAMVDTIKKEVSAFCAAKKSLNAGELKILQQRVAQLSLQARPAASGVSRVPVRAREVPGPAPAPAAKVTIASHIVKKKPGQGRVPDSPSAHSSGGDSYRSEAPASTRPDAETLRRQLVDTTSPEVLLSLVEQAKADRERELERKRIVEAGNLSRKALEAQMEEKRMLVERDRSETAQFLSVEAKRVAELTKRDAAAREDAARRVVAEKEARDRQVADLRRRREQEKAEARAAEDRALRELEAQKKAEADARTRDLERKTVTLAKQLQDNAAQLAKKAAEAEAAKEEDKDMMARYNRMLEAQDKARSTAAAAMLARTSALGDMATRDKVATEARRVAEEKALGREAEEAAIRAREMEEAERKERAEIALENRLELEAQMKAKRAKEAAARAAESSLKAIAKERAATLEREVEEQKQADAKRRAAYKALLDRQLSTKAAVAEREVSRHKERLVKELEVVADDADLLLQVQSKLAKMKAGGRK